MLLIIKQCLEIQFQIYQQYKFQGLLQHYLQLNINIHLLLADIYSKNTTWGKVVSECKKAIKIDAKSNAAYKMLGIAYYSMHYYELAEKTLNKTLALDPHDEVTKDLLAKISNKINR